MDRDLVASLADGVDGDLGRRIRFLLEIDALKNVIRRSRLTDGSRLENTAEHSWHLAMFALALAPHAGPEVDVERAIRILLVHDIVEVDAGDIFAYDDEGRVDKERLEQAAADRIFALLPADEAVEMRALWDEYEERSTPTAQFAYACDRLQPMLLNASSGGGSWQEHGIVRSQVEAFNAPIDDAVPEWWTLARAVIDEAVAAGVLGNA